MSGCDHNQVDCGPCGAQKRVKHWTIKQGSTFSHKLHIVNDQTGSSFDLTGYGVRAALRYDTLEKGTPIAEFVGTVIAPATKGWIRVSLGATVTRLLMDRGRYDVEIYKLDDPDVVYRVKSGRYVVDHEVTD
jgi:hypothetical protein